MNSRKSRLPYYESLHEKPSWVIPGDSRDHFFRVSGEMTRQIIIFYPAEFSTINHAEYILLQKSLNPEVLFISMHNENNDTSSQEKNLPPEIWKDLTEADSLYGIGAAKHLYLLDKEGFVRGIYRADNNVEIKNLILDVELLIKENRS